MSDAEAPSAFVGALTPSRREWLGRATLLGAALALAPTLLGLVADVALFDLVSHFREPLFWSEVILLIPAALGTRRRATLGALLFGLFVNGYFYLPYALPRSTEAPSADQPRFVVLQANVLTSNQEHQALIDLVRRTDPDLVALEEVDQRWLDDLEALRDRYPYVEAHPRGDNFGIAAFSRHPLREHALLQIADLPALRLRVQTPSRVLEVMVVHTIPPIGQEGFDLRNRFLSELGRLGQHADLVAGDLNLTPFSGHFARLTQALGMEPCRGFGMKRTWPTSFFVRLPIDHVLVGPRLRITRCEVQGAIGSDHYPLLVELSTDGGGRPMAPE